MGLFTRTPKGQQPQSPTPIAGGPNTRGLVSAPLWSVGARGVFDMAAPSVAWTLGGNEVKAPGTQGLALSYSTAGTGGMYRTPPFQPTTPFTALFLVNPASSTPGGAITVFAFATNTNDLPVCWVHQEVTTGNLNLFFRDNGGGGSIFSSGIQLTAGRFHVCAFRTNGVNNHNLYVNGKWVNDTSTVGTFTASTAYAIGGLFRTSFVAQSGLDQTHGPYLFNRALSDGEVDAWARNPWGLFEPANPKIWVPAFVAAVDDKPPQGEFGDYLEACEWEDITGEDMAPWDWSAESMVVGRDDVLPPPPPELPAYEEWEDVNDAETALYQWPWGQAPPIDENLTALGLEDASNQIEDEEELFSFSADPAITDAEFAFIQPYDASEQQEEDEQQDSDQSGPVVADFVSIMAAALVDDAASQQDEDEFLEADQTSPLAGNDEVGAGIYYDADEQYEEDEYLEADQASPLAADVASPMAASLVEDARDQPEDVIEEPIGVSYDPLPADRVLPVITIDSHDGSKKKKKRLPDETEHEYRLRNATRRSAVENAVYPPEPEPQAEETASIKPADRKIFAPPEKMAIIRAYSDAEIEADDQEVMDLVRKLDEEMLAILLKRL